MATFLDLVRSTFGLTRKGDRRSIVTTATGNTRVSLVAEMVRAAWTEIQNENRHWRFLVANLPDSALLVEGTTRYTPQNIANPAIINWDEWIIGDVAGTVPVSVWPAADSDAGLEEDRGREQALTFVDYRVFRQAYQTGSSVSAEQTGQPRAMSIDPQDGLVVWPSPDRNYRIAGTYRRTAQEFAADDDVPIIEAQHHDAIVWMAAVLVHRAWGADQLTLLTAEKGADSRMAALRRRYLPKPKLSHQPVGARTGRAFAYPLSPPNPNFAS